MSTNAAQTQQDNAAQTQQDNAASAQIKKPGIRSWVAHDPVTLKKIGSFKGRTARGIAQKVATKQARQIGTPVQIIVREAGTRRLFHFIGEKIELAEHKEVVRAGRVITYKTVTKVKSDKKLPKEWDEYMETIIGTDASPRPCTE